MKLDIFTTKPKKQESNCQKLKTNFDYLGTSYSVQTKEFFENSSLHGVKYIAETGRPFLERYILYGDWQCVPFERVSLLKRIHLCSQKTQTLTLRFLWFVCVTVGTIASLVIILSLWKKFQTNPTITGLDTDFHTWNVPFPAVFVCQEVPASTERIRKFLKIPVQENETSEEDKYLTDFYVDLTSLTLDQIPGFVNKYAKVIETIVVTKETILNLMYTNEEVFSGLRFGGEWSNVADFLPVFTENGFCYSYNSRHFEGKTPDDKSFLIKEIKETDFQWSLEFDVYDMDINSSIYILNSDEMISVQVQPQVYWDHMVNKVSFSYKETYTTKDTRQLSIKQRKCVFDDEIKLLVDNIYTYTACSIQCRMQMSKRLCNCVPHFYPETQGFPYCILKDFQCIASNLDKIKHAENCQCNFLRCKNAVYEVEKLLFISDLINDTLASTLKIEFVSWPMVKYKREVLFGWVDLLVSFGGIAGLFLGFSLLSGVEILYYFTIRAWIASVRERKELDRIKAETQALPRPTYDLSLVPYIWSEPLPGGGIDEIVKRQKKEGYGRNRGKYNRINVQPAKNVWSISRTIIPPYGIEFTH